MTKTNKYPLLAITKETLRWANTDHVIAYPIFIRDPAQQRHFLSAVPAGSAITLNFADALCDKTKITRLGQQFTSITPEKIVFITIQDILTRHGYRRGRILRDNTPLYHWGSTALGYLAWGIALLSTCISLYLFATLAPPPPPQTTITRQTGISPLLLQRLSELPGAIASLDTTPQGGQVMAYIPQERQAEFSAYMAKKSPGFPITWQHKILGKTKQAFIWEGTWAQR